MTSKMSNAHPYEETVYDFFSEGKLIFMFAGYSSLKRNDPGFIPYSIYRGMVFLFLTYVIGMSFTAAYVSSTNTADMFQAIHVSLMIMIAFFGLLVRLIADRALSRTVQIINGGVYRYNESEFDEIHEEIKKKYVSQIRNLNEIFKKLCTFGVLSNALLVPLIQLIMVDESSGKGILNPYLPQPVYMPFDTRNFTGYTIAFLMNALFIAMIMAVGTCMNAIFLGSTLQLKAQFVILNYSLRNLEKRAFAYVRKTKCEGISRNLYESEEFQESLYRCFRSNILHHQVLLRLKSTIQKCLGSMFLIVVALASLILAAHVLLIMEKPEIHKLANFIITLICEMLYSLQYCWFSEELTAESSEVYYSLYFTPWWNCDSRFRKLLLIMLSSTQYPVHIKTPGFNITASLNTFGSIITTMYQVMNLVRNTQ